jgi:hypothetical protein
MGKIKVILFTTLFLIFLNLIYGVSLATSPTLTIHANSPEYFKVKKIEQNKINCEFIYNYNLSKDGTVKMLFEENCCLGLSDDTIFINGKNKKIVEKEKAMKNIKEDMVIIACLKENANDVEKNGVQCNANIIIYNITDNIMVDDYVNPRYYFLENKFSVYNYNLNKKRFTVEAKNVYDKNGDVFDINSIILWKDLPGAEEFNMGDEQNNMVDDYIGIYWLDSNEQIEKIFLIEITELEKDEVVIEEKEDGNYYFNILRFVILMLVVFILIVLWNVLKKRKLKTTN